MSRFKMCGRTWRRVLLIAALYYVGARVSQLLALPPGNVTVVWLASGLALAALLVCNAHVWPSIWLRSCAFNVWALHHLAQGPPLAAILITASILGIGAMLTAWVGATLVRRLTGFPRPFARAYDALFFLFLSGPVSCLLSATVGVTSLAMGGFMPSAAYLYTWRTWWASDTIGVCVIAPLVLSWC